MDDAKPMRSTTPSGLVVEFRQHDWTPGFAAYLAFPDEPPKGVAFCSLDLGGFLATYDREGMTPAELAEQVADTMVHEVIHVIEHWSGVEFSEDRVENLIGRYRGWAQQQPEPESTGSETVQETLRETLALAIGHSTDAQGDVDMVGLMARLDDADLMLVPRDMIQEVTSALRLYAEASSSTDYAREALASVEAVLGK